MKFASPGIAICSVLIALLGCAQEKENTDLLSEKEWSPAGKSFLFDPEKGRLRVLGTSEKIATEEIFHDFHLVAEFKWGERTRGERADRARSFYFQFPGSVEVELLESVSGNLVINGQKIPNQAWNENWQDARGWHSREGRVENGFGLWNQIEVISRADSITVFLNGSKINSKRNLKRSPGKIGLRANGAECYFRKLAVYPPDTFAGRIKSKKSLGKLDSDFPREFPLSPEESAAAWKIDGDYDLQLVASEPLVCDPVDVAWDRKGRMLVAEMLDYPAPPDHGIPLSRIRLLLDKNGDGIMDQAKIWADQLDHVQGILSFDGGIVATTRSAVLFLKDTDGDDVADEISELFTVNEPRNVQLQIANPHWGIDNLIYFNNGLDLREIYPGKDIQPVSLWNTNLLFDPKTRQIEPVSGFGQFGACQDDWGRRFFCSNQNPAMTAVMPLWAVKRNPFDQIAEGHEDIAPSGRDAKVYPHDFSYVSSISHIGTNTSACGLALYRGGHIPELKGNLFVCEPTGQLVTRSVLKAKGPSFVAERVGEKKDFLVSSDEWSRPVNLRNGPDGALYICDMYRRFIDHARFFPEGFPKSHFMRAGFDQGRIYRLVKKGESIPAPKPLPESIDGLVAMLESPNSWQRVQAQDILVRNSLTAAEEGLRKILRSSESPEARVHAFWTLDGLGKLAVDDVSVALSDPVSGVVENAIMRHDPQAHWDEMFNIAVKGTGRARFFALLVLGNDDAPPVTRLFESLVAHPVLRKDPWLRGAILSGSERRAGEILSNISKNGLELKRGDPDADEATASLIHEFAAAVARRGVPGELAEILRALDRIKKPANRFAFAEGLADGLKQAPLPTTSLASFLNSPLPVCADLIGPLSEIVKTAEKKAINSELPVEIRAAAVRLAGEQNTDAFFPAALQLIKASSPPPIAAETMRVLRNFSGPPVEKLFYENWDQLTLATRQDAITILASGKGVAGLLERIKEGKIDKNLVDSVQRWNFSRAEDPAIQKLSREIFGAIDKDRANVVARYQKFLETDSVPPDLENGKKVIAKVGCLSCHRMGEAGFKVGPDLGNLRSKPPEVLLTDILDPNRNVSRNWMALSVSTVEGNVYTGIITGDGNTTLTLEQPGGFTKTIQRSQISNVKPLGTSFMPSGLEQIITEKDMKDLIFLLKQN